MHKESKFRTNFTLVFLFVMLIFVLYPFVLITANSFKSLSDIGKNVLSMPKSIYLENYRKAWDILSFPRATWNTIFVTVIGNAGLIVFATMSGFWLIRHPSRINKFIYAVLIASMAIPFQGFMIPMMRVARSVGLTNSLWGLGIGYWGLGSATVVFLSYGAIKSIPQELEEAATIDGANQLQIFWKIIFPLLQNMILTFTIINTFWFWNDYLMPQLMLGGRNELRTLQLSMRSLFSQEWARWDIALAALVMIITPILVFFIIVQRKVVTGLTSGSVKG